MSEHELLGRIEDQQLAEAVAWSIKDYVDGYVSAKSKRQAWQEKALRGLGEIAYERAHEPWHQRELPVYGRDTRRAEDSARTSFRMATMYAALEGQWHGNLTNHVDQITELRIWEQSIMAKE